ncbi:MAG: Aspartyl/glutamyl-tRNA(Asn/Gln) amidotransferase subunit B [Candidatus Pacebacteria bacterium GW2011_GWF2_38_9]|nr:MAG: aspartyl/glutamyl-tRNA(Asn/Gln) amidotransferase subunit B, aspartyl-tRNA(Asn)/glutamyl-tRNA (Gln) amidotransferase subunit B [candidate division TM6 bacterium GW2011_GWF2_28_16]KKQ08310.1 MAG: Aspartyl/glutamyl-tRNA(Asn/Gln) amidotransferase subunit B [Candidatus Pacebacteria bacterium GW2011_GWF1_36_5]KKQ88921.1 MAG: Aspartyl/glutamyl-tRNA(Asn/Gln) amidotransferase subunit B [Candidatus Pacebacteria bacterium GW2011_GWF2_38_9]HAZ73097.1 Asp-tRNA(Asn)/Glu-tRNA(Gln) amidotransferase subu
MPYKLVCGLEVHAELKTKSKMFCSCKNDPFGAPKPNLYTCPVCLGMPGALPVANRKAIEWTIKLGLALHCQINLFSKFDRKNYFYADLPKGYQISQYDIPFCHDGYLDTSEGRVGIHRIHLEEDTAKLSHQEIDFDGDGELDKVTLIDFNRSSVPLVEIVTEPDIISATQAKEYGQKLRQIMRYLDIANCDMEKGGMRLEANISLRREGKNELPDYKVECKNINSFKFLEAAINFEVDRQTTILQNGEQPIQETRGYNSTTGKTFSQRSKEDAADYRYFPDPDLPPIEFTTEEIETIRSEIPELPAEKTTRFMSEYNLNEKSAKNLAINMEQALFFEKILKEAKKENLDPQKLINNLLNGKIKFSFDEKISVIIAKFKAISSNENIDEKELQLAIDKVLNAEKDAVAKYKAGKTVVTGFLIGCVMKELGKKADVIQVKQQLIATLS